MSDVLAYGRLAEQPDGTQLLLQMGDVTLAVLDDTCGNLIQIAERREA